ADHFGAGGCRRREGLVDDRVIVQGDGIDAKPGPQLDLAHRVARLRPESRDAQFDLPTATPTAPGVRDAAAPVLAPVRDASRGAVGRLDRGDDVTVLPEGDVEPDEDAALDVHLVERVAGDAEALGSSLLDPTFRDRGARQGKDRGRRLLRATEPRE